MTSPTTTLNDALNSLSVPAELPSLLPLVHLSISKWFASIVSAGQLEPRQCKVFGKDLIYLFYGGVFYRPKTIVTRDATECPVAFVFSPVIIKDMFRAFPFDTGAIAGKKVGKWSTDLSPIEDYEATNSSDTSLVSKLVYHFFRENELYLKGTPNSACKTYPHPFPQVYDFYSDDLQTGFGVDQRQSVFECQFDVNIPFGQSLLWVGFPESMTLEYDKLKKAIYPHKPQFWPYSDHKIIKPMEITGQLELKAREDVIGRFI